MIDTFLLYLRRIVLFLLFSGILFLLFRTITLFIINLLSKIFPRRYVKTCVFLIILFLISVIPYYIIRDYIYVIRNCILIGYVETKEDSWIFSWKNNSIFMERNKLGSYNSLEEAYKESEKNKESEVILESNNKYDIYLVYEIGLLKKSLSKQLLSDDQVSISEEKIKELGYKNYYISYDEGRAYERTKEIVDKIVMTNDVKIIKKYYSSYIKGDYKTRGDESHILGSIACHNLTPIEILEDLNKREQKDKSVAVCLTDNINTPYEVLFDYIEIETGFRKLVHDGAIYTYTKKLKKDKRLEELNEIKDLVDSQNYKIFREIHEKYNKIYEN